MMVFVVYLVVILKLYYCGRRTDCCFVVYVVWCILQNHKKQSFEGSKGYEILPLLE